MQALIQAQFVDSPSATCPSSGSRTAAPDEALTFPDQPAEETRPLRLPVPGRDIAETDPSPTSEPVAYDEDEDDDYYDFNDGDDDEDDNNDEDEDFDPFDDEDEEEEDDDDDDDEL